MMTGARILELLRSVHGKGSKLDTDLVRGRVPKAYGLQVLESETAGDLPGGGLGLPGPVGPAGPAGPPGPAGVSIPGGLTGQALVKASDADYSFAWATLTASLIPFVAVGTLTSVSVQAALAELDGDLTAHIGAADPHPQYTTAAELAAYAQPLDADLTAIAALATTTYGRSLLTVADAAAGRASLGALTGTLTAGSVALSGGAATVTDSANLTFDLTTLTIDNAAPTLQLRESDAAADAKRWYLQANGGALFGYIANDANTVSSQWLSVTRSGATAQTVNLLPTASAGSLNVTSVGSNFVLELGGGQSGDSTTFVDLHAAEATYPDYAARVQRTAGANGEWGFFQRGTGALRLYTQEAAPIVFHTNNVQRGLIATDGSWIIGTDPGGSQLLRVGGSARINGSLTISASGGTLTNGSIYADGNWGMLFYSALVTPPIAHYGWLNGGGSQLMLLNPSGHLIVGPSDPGGGERLRVNGAVRASSGYITGLTSAAPAGGIGQVIQGIGTSVVHGATLTTKEITNVALTPGIWLIQGTVTGNGGGSATNITCCIHTTSAVLGGTVGLDRFPMPDIAGIGANSGSPAMFRTVAIAANTTYYLNTSCAHSGAPTWNGSLTATRIG